MVEILSQVCQDEEIKNNLNKQCSTAAAGAGNNSNSPDYKNLRERLLKEVVSSTNAQLVQNKPKPRTIFDNRPNLTANFLFDTSSSGSAHSLKGVPASSQENSLLQELLYTLLGNSGDHITPVSAPDNTVTFTLDKSIDQSLASLLQRLLPLAAHYSAVVSWCEDTGPVDGLVNQALVAGINLLLSDYTMLICQLEQSHSRGELTLHRYSTHQTSCIREAFKKKKTAYFRNCSKFPQTPPPPTLIRNSKVWTLQIFPDPSTPCLSLELLFVCQQFKMCLELYN